MPTTPASAPEPGAAAAAALWAISPLDGRYSKQLTGLGALVSEGALISYRIRVEAQWLLHLAALPALAPLLPLSSAVQAELHALSLPDSSAWQADVKAIEATTNHDVKAVEYFLQARLRQAGAPPAVLAFLHFACTSEDINNLAYALMLREVREQRLLPLLRQLIGTLATKAAAYAELGLLARTHGQTATPTTVGKELAVFGHRLARQAQRLASLPIEGKINGAVGNYNAHQVAFPDLDWPAVARSFVEERLGLSFNPLTTQIENHDSLVEYTAVLHHTNTILIGLCRDLWGYIALGYFRQTLAPGEVGSSTMPHKVNPIDFENAEGNLGIAASLAQHFSDKLPISRWQRDLSDSTVLRALGTLLGHTELAWRSLARGLGKIAADPERLAADLGVAWEVLAEPVQTVMRRYGVVDAYERLKAATRGKAVTREALAALIGDCAELPAAAKEALLSLRPETYTGLAAVLARQFAGSVLPGRD